jgi:hypothetical protein
MRKLRTRQHIIEDLGFNHVERQVLLAGYVPNRIVQNDYGYDGLIQTFTEIGEVENNYIFFQLKSTDVLQRAPKKGAFVFDLDTRDLELWLYNDNLVMLLLYDAQKEIAFYLDLQDHFKKNRAALQKVRKFVRIYIPQNAVFSSEIIREIRKSLK